MSAHESMGIVLKAPVQRRAIGCLRGKTVLGTLSSQRNRRFANLGGALRYWKLVPSYISVAHEDGSHRQGLGHG